MSFLALFCSFLILSALLVAIKPRCVWWAGVIGVVLLGVTWWVSTPVLGLIVLWVIYCLITVPLLLKPIRLKLITPILFQIFESFRILNTAQHRKSH